MGEYIVIAFGTPPLLLDAILSASFLPDATNFDCFFFLGYRLAGTTGDLRHYFFLLYLLTYKYILLCFVDGGRVDVLSGCTVLSVLLVLEIEDAG